MSHRKTWFSGALTLAMVAILLIALPAAAAEKDGKSAGSTESL